MRQGAVDGAGAGGAGYSAQPALQGAARVGVGVLLAAPLLLIFGGLFASADANFAQLVRDLFNWDLRTLIEHLFVMSFFAWVAAGFLRAALISSPVRLDLVDQVGGRLGIVEVATALGLLDVLFLTFVVLQFPYLFGSASNLGYAEYARRGFFELVAVAALALPVLLASHGLLRKGVRAHARVYNILAGLLVALLFVVMASALQRMAFYVGEFGLTELRLYSTAFMAWLALVFAWFVLTTLMDVPGRLRLTRAPDARTPGEGTLAVDTRSGHFAFGMLAAGLAVTFALNALDPDAFIARTNLGLRRPLDVTYLSTLSADALPVWLDALPDVPQAERCRAAALVLARWSSPSTDWRAWNVSRARAAQLVDNARERQYLRETACRTRE